MTDDLAALAAEFTRWHIWRGRSAAGRETDWHATSKARGDGKRGRLAAPDAAWASARPRRTWPSAPWVCPAAAARITVNLSPADFAKEGSHYDLPIALGLPGRHG